MGIKMTIRLGFHHELDDLKGQIKEFADLTDHAFKLAVESLIQKDMIKAQSVIERDIILDQKELAINEKAILLIAKQQPLAKDLRKLIISLRISSDLERMADHAVNIAKSTLRLGSDYPNSIHLDVVKMAEKARDMARVAMEAFENEDISLAKKLSEMDDDVDEIYHNFTKNLFTEAKTANDIQPLFQLAFSARFVERYADYITNIGESIFYLVKGEEYDLN
jgi:phosphate transport system protein